MLEINILPGEGIFADIGWEPVSGFEPLTCRLQGAIGPSWTVAGRRLISRLPAPIVAGRRPTPVTRCLRWLPFWLPASDDPAASRLHMSGFAASTRCQPGRLIVAGSAEAQMTPASG